MSKLNRLRPLNLFKRQYLLSLGWHHEHSRPFFREEFFYFIEFKIKFKINFKEE